MDFLGRNPAEWDKFFKNFCINVSEFFRDPDVFKSCQQRCFLDIINNARKEARTTIDIWSCGCSCGEESYSLAITFLEFFKKHDINDMSINITATDIDVDALMSARHGIYFASALENVPEPILKEYFTFVPKEASHLEEDTWQVNDNVRRLVSFKKHNVITDGALRSMDVIFLRNVRIYFDRVKAKHILIDAHLSLRDGGILVLGKIESVGVSLRHLFDAVDAVNRIYKKI